MRRYLPTSEQCFICGEANAAGLQTRFYVEGESVCMPLTARAEHCGYPGRVHGGVVAAALDECMGWAAARAIQRMCVTGDLRVRYVEGVLLPGEYVVRSEVERANRRLVYTVGKVVDPDGKLYARGEAKFFPLSREQTLKVDAALNYRGDEERVFAGLHDEGKE